MKIIYYLLYLLLVTSYFAWAATSNPVFHASIDTKLHNASSINTRLDNQREKIFFNIPSQRKLVFKIPDRKPLKLLQDYTVQVSKSSNLKNISNAYKQLSMELTNSQKKYLRITKAKNSYILMVGKFNSRKLAVLLTDTIRKFFPIAFVQKTYINREHILKILINSGLASKKEKLKNDKFAKANPEKEKLKIENNNDRQKLVFNIPKLETTNILQKLEEIPYDQNDQNDQSLSILQRLEQLPVLDKIDNKNKTLNNFDNNSATQPFYGGDRQVGLIQARIYNRKGKSNQALKAYKKLRNRYPFDEEIWEDFAEAHFYNADYEAALAETTKLLTVNPNNLRGQRIQAATLSAMKQYTKTFPIYENLLSRFNEDVGILSDYADAKLNAGDWVSALNYYCQVLEIDPDNRNALRIIHAIQRGYRPQLTTSYNSYQQSGDVQTDTVQSHYQQYLSKSTKLDLDYRRVDITRPADIEASITQINKTLNDFSLTVHQQLDNDFTASVGVGIYGGSQTGNSLLLGISKRLFKTANIDVSYSYARPWYDPVEAALLSGSSNQYKVDFSWIMDQTWGLYLGMKREDYMVKNSIDYGTKQTYTGIITKRLFEDPGLSISYSIYKSEFTYADESFQPISMLDDEMIHSVSFTFEHRFCTNWYSSLSGGFSADVERSVNSWFFSPQISIKLGNRMDLSFGYNYVSETESAEGGVSETFNVSSKVIF